MFHITSSLFGGLAVVVAWALVAPVDPASKQAGPAAARAPAASVNQGAKADRLAPGRADRGGEGSVSTVEVIGVHDASIVYRDRDGRLLLQTGPMSNVTVVSKNVVLPRLSVRETSRSVPLAIEEAQQVKMPPAVPIGCDPLGSPVVDPQLAHLTGRCLV